MDNNCWNCKNHLLANGNCESNVICDNYILDTEDVKIADKLIRYLSKDCYINNYEAEQIMCEIIGIFNRYGIYEHYQFILKDYSYCCLHGIKYEKLNVLDWDKTAFDFGFSMLIESNVWSMMKDDPDQIHEDCDYEGNTKDSYNMIQCYAKLRRVFRRYGLEWKLGNGGYLISFRKRVVNSKVA